MATTRWCRGLGPFDLRPVVVLPNGIALMFILGSSHASSLRAPAC